MTFTTQRIVVGDTVDFVLNAEKDGVVWDITGATITLYLQKPDGTLLSGFAATISNPTGGIAHYITAESVLDVEGDWIRQWKVSKSGVVLRSEEYVFSVLPALA